MNAVVDLPRALAASELKTQTTATGHTVEYLASFGTDFTEPDAAADVGDQLPDDFGFTRRRRIEGQFPGAKGSTPSIR